MTRELSLAASDTELGEELEGSKRLVVEDYQRKYDWGEPQWDDFWGDLNALAGDRPTHFLGTTVMVKRPEEDPKTYEIVDGQQRFTTISIVLCVIRDLYYEMGGEYTAHGDTIHEKYLSVKNSDMESLRKLILTRYNDETYEKVYQGQNIDSEEGKVAEAYRYYRKKFEAGGIETTDTLRKHLIGDISMVIVETEVAEYAYLLFESLNNRGLELSPVDLIKNRVFKIASDIDRIERKGEEIEHDQKTLTQVKKLWSDTIHPLEQHVDQQRRFFQHYLMSSHDYGISDTASKTTLYKKFRGNLDDYQENADELISLMEDLKHQAETYADLVSGQVTGFGDDDAEINQLIQDSTSKFKSARILVLRLLDEADDSKDLIRYLRMLRIYSTRQSLMPGGVSGSARSSVFTKICNKESLEGQSTFDEVKDLLGDQLPSDSSFREAVRDHSFKNNDQSLMVLTLIEKFGFGNEEIDPVENDLSLEYIMPTNLSFDKYEIWKDYLQSDTDEYEELYSQKLGNITITDHSIPDGSAPNPFLERRDELVKTDLKINEDLDGYEDWGVDFIENRTSKLTHKAVEVFSFDRV